LYFFPSASITSYRSVLTPAIARAHEARHLLSHVIGYGLVEGHLSDPRPSADSSRWRALAASPPMILRAARATCSCASSALRPRQPPSAGLARSLPCSRKVLPQCHTEPPCNLVHAVPPAGWATVRQASHSRTAVCLAPRMLRLKQKLALLASRGHPHASPTLPPPGLRPPGHNVDAQGGGCHPLGHRETRRLAQTPAERAVELINVRATLARIASCRPLYSTCSGVPRYLYSLTGHCTDA